MDLKSENQFNQYKILILRVGYDETIKSGFGSGYRAKSILTDPKTNKKYEFPSYGDATDTLLTALKNRVPEMNVIGFFIAGSGKRGNVDRRTLSYVMNCSSWGKEIDAAMKKLRKEKVLVIEHKGYDEYYILPGGASLEVENETLSDDLVGASKGKLKTAFGKMQKGKIGSRVLLNKFTKLIA